MSEKSRLSSRFLFFLIPVSMFFFIISSVSLLQLGNISLLPGSIFKLILVNSTSFYFKSNDKSEPVKIPIFSSMPSQIDTKSSMRSGVKCPNSEIAAIGKNKKKNCDPNQALLRVYMYDLPPEFHFGLLDWKRKANQTWPNVLDHIPPYPGGLNLQHSMEYWLTLDLLASSTPDVRRPCSAVRVQNSSLADIIFVPFFSSLSYNRHSKVYEKEKVSVNQRLQDRLVQVLMGQDEWKRFGGRDHLIVAHHPNSMLDARKMLGSAMFILADFGRYPVEIANPGKDIIAPYKHVVRTISSGESAQFDERPILVFFQGAIYRKDVSFSLFSLLLQTVEMFITLCVNNLKLIPPS